MPITSTYTTVADYILDQLWGFASANTLKSSVQYLSELLGDPSVNTNNVSLPSSLTVAADLLVNGNTTFGNALTDLVTVVGELKGSRGVYNWLTPSQASPGLDTYITGSGFVSAQIGYIATRPGSIVGASMQVNCVSFTTAETFTPTARISGVTALAISSISVTGTGSFTARGTQARGTSNFVAGDIIQYFYDLTSAVGNHTSRYAGQIEVVFDT